MPSFLARCYAEPVDVRRRDDQPDQFMWRGRLYVVREVLEHWVQTGAWWRSPALTSLADGATTQGGDVADDAASSRVVELDDEYEFWRVSAARGRGGSIAVVELCFAWATGSWTVTAVAD